MLVKKCMSKKVITVDAEDSMGRAVQLMKENDISILPVMKNEKLVGVVTDRDIKKASASEATTLEVHELMYLIARIKVKQIMTKDPITVPYNYTIEETAEILMENNISGVPVVDDEGSVVGIITKNDLFKELISLTGLRKRGVLFSCRIPDKPGSIKDIADILRKYGGRLASILSTYDGVPEGSRDVYLRAYNLDRSKMDQVIEEISETGTLFYVIDHRENKRQIFITEGMLEEE